MADLLRFASGATARLRRPFRRPAFNFVERPRPGAKIRGSLNVGPVVASEIGDVKRAIVFNGDTVNTAARLVELSRAVEDGFLAASAAVQAVRSGAAGSHARYSGARRDPTFPPSNFCSVGPMRVTKRGE